MSDSSQMPDSSRYDAIDLASLLYSVALDDKSAFEALYKATSRKLYGLAYRITLDHSLSEEVMSDTYLQVWRQAVNFDQSRASALSWMMMICRSRALDLLRKTNRQPTTPDIGQDTVLSIENSEEFNQPFNIVDTIESNSALHKAIAALDDQERQLLTLAYFRNYSHSEMAKITGLPLGTVKTKLRRSIKQLSILMSSQPSRSQYDE